MIKYSHHHLRSLAWQLYSRVSHFCSSGLKGVPQHAGPRLGEPVRIDSRGGQSPAHLTLAAVPLSDALHVGRVGRRPCCVVCVPLFIIGVIRGHARPTQRISRAHSELDGCRYPRRDEVEGGSSIIIRDELHENAWEQRQWAREIAQYVGSVPRGQWIYSGLNPGLTFPAEQTWETFNPSDPKPSSATASNGRIASKHHASNDSEGYRYQGWSYEEDGNCHRLEMGDS